MREMQWFLIRTFIWILAAVSVAEYLLQAAVNHFVMPVVSDRFFPELSGTLSVGVESAAALVLFLLSVLLLGGARLLPAPFSSVSQWLANWLERLILSLVPALGRGALQMSGTKKTILALILLAEVFLILVPVAVGAVIFARVVTREFAKLEQERDAVRREYDRQRNLMLSDIAHDLRTPITTVAGYAEALSQGMAEPERVQEYLDAIRNKSVRMNELITLLFDYVKLDSEGFSLSRKPLDLCELLRENAALIYSEAEDKRMELTVEIPEERVEIEADHLQMARVVTNLLTNAIRHNEAGTKLGLYLIQEDERLLVAVADSGSPIEATLAERIFYPFFRVDEARSGGGSGLGLSIAHKIVAMHGGSLSLVQQPALQKLAGLEHYAKAFVINIRA